MLSNILPLLICILTAGCLSLGNHAEQMETVSAPLKPRCVEFLNSPYLLPQETLLILSKIHTLKHSIFYSLSLNGLGRNFRLMSHDKNSHLFHGKFPFEVNRCRKLILRPGRLVL